MDKKYTYEDVMKAFSHLKTERKKYLDAVHAQNYQALEKREVGMMQEAMETGQLPEELKQRMPNLG